MKERQSVYGHIGTRFAILYAICTNVVRHAGSVTLCLPATASVAGTLDDALLVDQLCS